MMRLNKEKSVFLGALVVFALLVAGKISSILDDSVPTIRPKGVAEVAVAIPDVPLVDPSERIWSEDRRNFYEKRQEVEDLPPVDLPFPPLRPRPVVAPLLDPLPPPTEWHRFAFEVRAAAPIGQAPPGDLGEEQIRAFVEDASQWLRDLETSEVEGDRADWLLEAGDALDALRPLLDPGRAEAGAEDPVVREAVARFLRVAVGLLGFDLEVVPEAWRPLAEAPEETPQPGDGEDRTDTEARREAPVEERFDRVFRGNETIFGSILNDDPFSLLGDELPLPDRFKLRAGTELQFSVIDVDSGRPLGRATYRPDQIDGFALAATLDNQIRLRLRKLRPGDLRGRLDLALWCLERGAFDYAAENFRKVLDEDASWNRGAAAGLVRVFERDARWDALFLFFREVDDRGIEDAGIEEARGRTLEKFGLDAEAETALRRCVSLDPGRAEAWLLLSQLLYRKGAYEEAVSAAESAERGASAKGSALAEARRARALALLALGRADDAARIASSILEESVTTPDLLAMRARILVFLGRPEEALGAIGEIPPDPEGAREVLSARGLAHVAAGDLRAAASDFSRAADADPIENFWGKAGLAYVRLVEGRMDDAFDALQEAIRRFPDHPYGHYLLGRFHLASGNAEDALAEFEQTYRRVPEVTEILGDLGFTHLLLDAPAKAAAYLEETTERRPESVEAHALLGIARIGEGRLDEARAEITQAIDLAKRGGADSPQALLALAYLDYRSGDEDGIYRAMGGLMRVGELLASAPDDPLARYAARSLAEIEDNRSKCFWEDGFNRLQIRRGWEIEQSFGVQVRLVEGGIRFEGTQRTRDEETTWLEHPAESRTVVRFQARLQAAADDPSRVGVSIVLRGTRGEREVQGGIYFAKDPRGHLAYRIVERSKPEPWVILDAPWPASGSVMLAVELQSEDEGTFRLLADGEEVARDVAIPALRKPRTNPRVGVFGTAALGTPWSLVADDVRVVMRKEGETR